jgi:hypothetical protein
MAGAPWDWAGLMVWEDRNASRKELLSIEDTESRAGTRHHVFLQKEGAVSERGNTDHSWPVLAYRLLLECVLLLTLHCLLRLTQHKIM